MKRFVTLILLAWCCSAWGQSAFRPDDVKVDSAGDGSNVVNLRRMIVQEGSNVTFTVDGDTLEIEAAAGGSDQPLESDSTGDGSGAESFSAIVVISENTGTILNRDGDTLKISTTLGTSIADGEVDNDITIDGLSDSTTWNTAYGWGDHTSAGYLTTGAAASTYETITNVGKIGDDTTNFKTAYGWGDHASGGYLTGNQTITLSGDATGSGETTVAVTVIDDAHSHTTTSLDEFGTMTATGGRVLVADGTDFESVAMSGDVAIASGGATTIQPEAVDSDDYVDGSVDFVHLSSAMFGIDNNDVVQVDGTPVEDEYARWNATGLEGRSFSQVAGDLQLVKGVNVQSYDPDLSTLALPGAWKAFYANGSQALVPLSLGADGTYLMSNGAAVAPTFETPTDNDTQLSEEEVEDFAGGMLGGTETGIAVTYQDGTNDIDFEVDEAYDFTWTGDHDFGDSAHTVELPQARQFPSFTDGHVGIDTTFHGSNLGALAVHDGTSVKMIPTLKHFSALIWLPATIQGEEDAIPILSVESQWAPNGITLVDLGIKLDHDTTYSVAFEEWTDPVTFSSAIETVATSSSDEAQDDGTLTDPDIAAGSIVFINLPADSVTFLKIWGTYYVDAD